MKIQFSSAINSTVISGTIIIDSFPTLALQGVSIERLTRSFSLQQRRGLEAAMLPEQVQLSFLSLASAEEQLRHLGSFGRGNGLETSFSVLAS